MSNTSPDVDAALLAAAQLLPSHFTGGDTLTLEALDAIQATTMSLPGGAIAVEGVRHSYPGRRGRVQALGPLDLTVAPGEFLVLAGASGCGKVAGDRRGDVVGPPAPRAHLVEVGVVAAGHQLGPQRRGDQPAGQPLGPQCGG